MSGTAAPAAPDGPAPATIYFLSDYGLVDEFVGVVHAVLRRRAPEVAVVDLTHQVPPFDVAAGAAALVRAAPHLGPGAVLAVVDPGVGGTRRALALRTRTAHGDLWLVGPDNGLLVPAADAGGGIMEAVELAAAADGPPVPGSTTFDGRDLFAPAAAALARGEPASSVGRRLDPAGLCRLTVASPPPHRAPGGGARLATEVRWVDRFGNAQLGVAADDGGLPAMVVLRRRTTGDPPDADGAPGAAGVRLRRVRAYAELGAEEFGLLADANGQWAVVGCRRSAAEALGLVAGQRVELVW